MLKRILILMVLLLSCFSFAFTQKHEKTGYKFDDATYNIDTWYLHTNKALDRKFLWVMNNGVNNDLATGVVYVSIHTTNTVETAAVTDATIIPLNPGDCLVKSVHANIYLSIQADTTNTNCLIDEYELW